MMVSIVAKAQFTVTVEGRQATNWGQEVTGSIKLSDVATALGTDTTTLVAEFKKGAEGALKVALDEGEGVMNTNYTQGDFGNFWMTAEGKALPFGDAALRFFNITSMDAVNDQMNYLVGQKPNETAVGDVYKANIVYTLGEKTATVAIQLTVVAAPESAIKVETTKLSELTIAKDYELPFTLKEGGAYEGSTIELDMADVYATLGVATPAEFDEFIDETAHGVYATSVVTEK